MKNENEQSCKTCKFFKPIYCHPTNTIGHGQMSEQFGYICTLFKELENGPIIFMDERTAYVGCEMHSESKID